MIAWLEEVSTQIERLAQRYRYWLVGLWSLLYFTATFYRATHKLFWFDEIYTFYICHLSSMREVWHVTTHGLDYNPPLFYLLTRLTQNVAGQTELGTRLPEILGFWLFSVCLYKFVASRTTALAGLITMAFPAITTADYYAFEARPHGIVLGLGALALVSWQVAAEPSQRRWLPLALLAISLAGALLCHSYGFVVFTPIVAGEVFRFIRSRRPDWPMWFALTIGASAILVSIPLLHASQAYLPQTFAKRHATVFFAVYPHLLGPAMVVFCVAIALYCTHSYLRLAPQTLRQSTLRPWEFAAIIGSLFIPFVVAAVALVSHSPIQMRFSLFVVGGMACLLGLSLWRRAVSALLCLLVIMVLYVEHLREFRNGTFISEPASGTEIYVKRSELDDVYNWMRTDPHRDLPILLIGRVDFAELLFYAPPDIRSRLMYSESTWPHPGYLLLQKCCGAPGRPSNDLRSVFLAYSHTGSITYVRSLWRKGAQFSLEKASDHAYLWLVDYDPARALGKLEDESSLE
jgi:hypothetical protein